MSKVHLGSVVSIYYKGGVKGEAPIDERTEGEPLTVMIGDMKLPKGVENALMDMEPGQEKTVDIEPEYGYGDYKDGLAQWYPRMMLKDGYNIKVDDVMFHTNPEDGHVQPAFVTEVTEDNVKIDFNHPFAGKTLEYWIKLVDIPNAAEE